MWLLAVLGVLSELMYLLCLLHLALQFVSSPLCLLQLLSVLCLLCLLGVQAMGCCHGCRLPAVQTHPSGYHLQGMGELGLRQLMQLLLWMTLLPLLLCPCWMSLLP